MNFFIPIIVILLFTYAFSLLLKIKFNASLFITTCFIILWCFLFVFLNILHIGIILFAIIAILSAVAITLYLMIKKQYKTHITGYFLRPGLAVFLFIVAFLFAILSDTYLYGWDDYSHWALAVRAFYLFDGLQAMEVLAPQTMGTPLFNTFFVSLSNYQEGYILCSQQLFIWVCALLPLSNVKWKDYKRMIIYLLIMYALLSHEMHYALSLGNDITLSVVTGGLLGYYFWSENKTSTETLFVMFAGLFLLPHMKRVTGIIFAVFVATLIVYDLYKKKRLINQKSASLIFSALIATPVASYAIQHVITHLDIQNATPTVNLSDWWNQAFIQTINAIKSPLGIAFSILLLISFGLLVYAIIKRTRLRWYLSACAVFSIGLAANIFRYLDGPTLELIRAYIPNAIFVEIYGLPLYKLLGLGIVIFICFYYLLFKPDEDLRKESLNIAFIVVIEFLIYLLILMASYTMFTQYEAMISASLGRYIRSFLDAIFVFGLIILFFKHNLFSGTKKVLFVQLTIFTLVFFKLFPAPFTFYSYQKNYNYETSVCGVINSDIKLLKEVAEPADNIYFIAQHDSNYVRNRVVYYLLPNQSKKLGNTTGAGNSDFAAQPTPLSADEFRRSLINGSYDYLYIYYIEDDWIELYQEMFENKEDISKHSVYEIVYDDENSPIFRILEKQ